MIMYAYEGKSYQLDLQYKRPHQVLYGRKDSQENYLMQIQ